ncbi:hypothetical protein CT409_23795 [Salmonella enterica]|nr:hypothetical protein [Salmonella enterica]
MNYPLGREGTIWQSWFRYTSHWHKCGGADDSSIEGLRPVSEKIEQKTITGIEYQSMSTI